MTLVRCALAIVTLVASGIASASLTYDYSSHVLFDSSTSLYWTSGPRGLSGWQVATQDQATSLFSEVGSWSSPPSGPTTFSTVVADLVLFFSTGAPSPRPVAGSLPAGNLLGNLPPSFTPPGVLTYGVAAWTSNAPLFNGFEDRFFSYYGSTDVSLNDWRMATASTIGNYGGSPGRPLPADATTFFLVSATNPVPEPQTWLLLVVGLGMLHWFHKRIG